MCEVICNIIVDYIPEAIRTLIVGPTVYHHNYRKSIQCQILEAAKV